MPDQEKDDVICIGKIGRAHGVKGMVHVMLYTENPELLLEQNGVCNQNGESVLEIEDISPHKNAYLAKIKGISNRDEAESLCHKKLYISRNVLPELNEDDSFYYIDLVGLAVVSEGGGESLGKITSVQNFGAGDLLEIQPDDKMKKSFFVPFTKTYVPDINLLEEYVTVFLPEGFFDVPDKEE